MRAGAVDRGNRQVTKIDRFLNGLAFTVIFPRIKPGASPCGLRPVQLDLLDVGRPCHSRLFFCAEAIDRPGSRKRSRRKAASPPCGFDP
jgi:hypothetical protein